MWGAAACAHANEDRRSTSRLRCPVSIGEGVEGHPLVDRRERHQDVEAAERLGGAPDDVPARLRPRQVRLDDERAAAVPANRGRGLFGLLPRLVIAEGHVHAARREGGGDGGADARAAGDKGGAASDCMGRGYPLVAAR